MFFYHLKKILHFSYQLIVKNNYFNFQESKWNTPNNGSYVVECPFLN